MTEFTPWLSLLGGCLIGLAAVFLMALHGRIAGMSGILTSLIPPFSPDWGWRLAFLIGAITAPALFVWGAGYEVPFNSPTPTLWLIIGGLLVGAGVYFGGGCTSGHGVCGLARISPRSIVATVIFMATTTITVFVIRHLIGGL